MIKKTKRTKQSKKNLNKQNRREDVPEIPFTYDFYLVYWEDKEIRETCENRSC